MLEVFGALVVPFGDVDVAAQGDRAAEPVAEGGVIPGYRPVWQGDLDPLVGQLRGAEEQLGFAVASEPESGLDVEDRVAAVAFDSFARDLCGVHPLALKRLDRVAPDLRDVHGDTLARAAPANS